MEDKRELNKGLGKCIGEIFITRVLPITAVVMGIVFAWQRLLPPAQRKNPLLLYPITGFCVIVIEFIRMSRNCLECEQPKLQRWYHKVSPLFL